jgi:hypothetical protein
MTAASTSRAVNAALRERDEQWAFKLILQGRDHLRLLLDAAPEEPRTWTRRRQRIRNERYDVLLRVVIGQEFTERDRTCPEWTRDARLDQPWVLENPFLGVAGTRAETPLWLAKANIFIAERDLATA